MPRQKSQPKQPTLPLPDATSAIPTTFNDSLLLPSMIVFDLDYTLWPFWVDTHISGPVKPSVQAGAYNSKMLDRWGEGYGFYNDVPMILSAAREKGVTMSLASRTHAPGLARDMLKGLHIPQSHTQGASETQKPLRAMDIFVHPQIYPGTKTTHFKKLQTALAKSSQKKETIPFEDMLFFDDEGRNRNVETELGATFWLVPDGVSRDEFDRGVWEWRRRRGITKQNPQGDVEDAAELEG